MKKAIIWVLVCMLVGILSRITFVQWTNAISIEMRHLEALEQNNLALQQNLAFSEQLVRNRMIHLQNNVAHYSGPDNLKIIEAVAQSYRLHYSLLKELDKIQNVNAREAITQQIIKCKQHSHQIDSTFRVWRKVNKVTIISNQLIDSTWQPLFSQTSIQLIKDIELLVAKYVVIFPNLDHLENFAIYLSWCGYCIPQHDLKLIPRSRIVTEGSTWEATLLLTADNLRSYNKKRPFIELAAYDQTLHSTNAQVSPIPNKPAYTISFLVQSDAFDNQEERQKQWEGQWNVHPHCLPKEEMDTTFSLKVDYTVKKK